MNQIDIFRAFSIWSRYNMPTANQRSLFYGLLEVWNDTRLVRSDEWLSVPNRTLETISGLSQKTCDNVKNQLQQQGILKIIPGKRNKDAAKYNISFWVNVKKEEDFTVTPTATVTPKLSSDVTVTSTAKLSSYTEKSREEKSKEEDDVVNDDPVFFDALQKNLGRGVTYPESQLARVWRKDTNDEMIIKAVNIAALSRKTNFKYIDTIIKNWLNSGITTLSELQEHEEKRERSRQNSGTKPVKPAPNWSNPSYKNKTTAEDLRKLEELRQESLSKLETNKNE